MHTWYPLYGSSVTDAALVEVLTARFSRCADLCRSLSQTVTCSDGQATGQVGAMMGPQGYMLVYDTHGRGQNDLGAMSPLRQALVQACGFHDSVPSAEPPYIHEDSTSAAALLSEVPRLACAVQDRDVVVVYMAGLRRSPQPKSARQAVHEFRFTDAAGHGVNVDEFQRTLDAELAARHVANVTLVTLLDCCCCGADPRKSASRAETPLEDGDRTHTATQPLRNLQCVTVLCTSPRTLLRFVRCLPRRTVLTHPSHFCHRCYATFVDGLRCRLHQARRQSVPSAGHAIQRVVRRAAHSA